VAEEEPFEHGLVDKYDEMRKTILLDKSRSRLTNQIQQLNHEISQLKDVIIKREKEIHELKHKIDELSRENELIQVSSKGEIQNLKEERDQFIHARVQTETTQLQDTIKDLKDENKRLYNHLTGLEIFSIGAVTGVSNSVDNLKDYIYTRGSPEHKVLLNVLERGNTTIVKIIENTKLSPSQVDQHLQSLKEQGLIQILNNQVSPTDGLIPAQKSNWAEIPREALMIELSTFLQKVKDDPERVAKTLEDISEVLTDKYQIRGVLIYQIRTEVTKWYKHKGNFQELKESINDWQNRL
jgi:sugar-specific transcriptional regulator TrmB